MISTYVAYAFCLLLGAWLACNTYGDSQVPPQLAVHSDQWEQQPTDPMHAVPPRILGSGTRPRGSGFGESLLWIVDTDFRLHDDIGFFIRRMLIDMKPIRPGILLLDDPTAMVAKIRAGDIFVSDNTLATLLNQDLAGSHAAVRNLVMITR